MQKLNLLESDWQDRALESSGPTCLIIRAWLEPVAEMDRFQPAGFPEIGHVIYDAPRKDGAIEKVCIVDSPASMANHLETVCLDGPTGGLHADLKGLPYVQCVTDKNDQPAQNDPLDTLVCTTLTEGHRLASDYFLDGSINSEWNNNKWAGARFRDTLRQEFGVKEVKKDSTYFIWPDTWWKIFNTIFKYDPNSLVHGVLFAKEQIKISRMLTAHLEAFGAARVNRSGVKFDRLGKTTSGQPLFAVDEETASSIVATFILDLALLRSYGRTTTEKGNTETKGLTENQKRLLLDLAVWKVKQLLKSPFRFRSECRLRCKSVAWADDTDGSIPPEDGAAEPTALNVDISNAIKQCGFEKNSPTRTYYPSSNLFKVKSDENDSAGAQTDEEESDTEE